MQNLIKLTLKHRMVLRGSKVVPDESLPSQLNEKKDIKHEIEHLHHEKEEATNKLIRTISASTDVQSLVDTVYKLKVRVADLEAKEAAQKESLLTKNLAINKTLKQLACGGFAGAIARTTVAPMDRIKIMMQTSYLKGNEAQYSSISQSLRHITKTEGVSSLWKGNLTNCVRVVPHTAVQFVAYEKFKTILSDEHGQMDVSHRLVGGALAGMSAATCTQWLDVVRIRLQTEPGVNTVKQAFKHVYAENGIRSFYKGYFPAMLSLSPFIAVNFAAFDTLKTWYFGADKNLSKKEMQSRNPFAILGMGALSGLFAQTIMYPLDTVRRRSQLAGTNYSSTLNAFQTIFKVEGPRGFYKGISANAAKVAPNNAIRFAAFEVLKSWFVHE